MSERPVSVRDLPDAPDPDFAKYRSELISRFRDRVQREITAQLAAGHTIYYSGTGDEAGRLFMHTPDGRRFEYRVHADGTHDIVGERPQ